MRLLRPIAGLQMVRGDPGRRRGTPGILNGMVVGGIGGVMLTLTGGVTVGTVAKLCGLLLNPRLLM